MSVRKRKDHSKRIVIFDCFSGISGDMTIGAFLDAGVDFTFLKNELTKLGLKGYRLKKSKRKKKGFTATDFAVTLVASKKQSHHGKGHSHHHDVTLNSIKKMIEKSSLSEGVKGKSIAIFTELARAEASVHGTTVNTVHFHEVGAVDSIIDIVGVAICLEAFGIDAVYAKNIHLGNGFLRGTAHGSIPVPAPATINLLEGYPVVFSDIEHELVTPTGASFIKTLTCAGEKIPPCTVEAVGYGAGDSKLEHQANVLRLVIGRTVREEWHETVVRIDANIDDMAPLFYEDIFEKAFECGALDVFVTPILMKKGRPAHMLSVLCEPREKESLCDMILRETSTIGVRFSEQERIILPRAMKRLKTVYGMVDVKVTHFADGTVKAYPEYASCKRIAKRRKIPVRTVYGEVERAILEYPEKELS